MAELGSLVDDCNELDERMRTTCRSSNLESISGESGERCLHRVGAFFIFELWPQRIKVPES